MSNIKSVQSFIKANGAKYIMQTKPQQICKITPSEIKYIPSKISENNLDQVIGNYIENFARKVHVGLRFKNRG